MMEGLFLGGNLFLSLSPFRMSLEIYSNVKISKYMHTTL